MKTFKELGIDSSILQSLEELKFEKPSEIQEKAIPYVLDGKDIIAGSATGSGKTLAFGVGLLQNAEPGKGVQGLVLTPTRELAEQVMKSLQRFSRHRPLNIISIYGGVAIEPQIKHLPNADIVVGTPGRILDHIERRTIRLDEVKMLVLDEADRMLDMGFIDDMSEIIAACPKNRQTLLFSATISPDIAHLARTYMNNPMEIAAERMVDPSKLTQVYYDIPDGLKFSLLVHLLKQEKEGIVMVFCNTRRNTDFVVKNLKFSGIDALAIHGGFSQDKRNKTLKNFHAQKATILVCTDVAARGLDIKSVSHVYNYDIPNDAKEYVHRIGRTARAGTEGKAINIITSRDYENFADVLKHHSDYVITRLETPMVDRVRIRIFDERRDNRDGHERRGNNSRGYGGHTRGHSHRGSQNRQGPRRDSSSGRSNDSRRTYSRGNRGRTFSRSGPRR